MRRPPQQPPEDYDYNQASSISETRLTLDDVAANKWQIEKINEDGKPAEVGTLYGLPEAHRCRELAGAGTYHVTPLDDNGRKIEYLTQIKTVSPPIQPVAAGSTSASSAAPAPVDDLPPYLRMMLQQAADDRREARRRAEEAEARREKWEQEQRTREWERAEREERARAEAIERDATERRAAADRADAERKAAADRLNVLVTAGLSLAGTMVQAFSSRAEPKSSINDTLLAALVQKQSAPAQTGGSLKDSLDLLLVLDQVADRRAERSAPAVVEKEDDGLIKSMMGILPMILAMRGGGGEAAAQAMAALQAPGGSSDPSGIAENLVSGILRDPDALAQIASRDPDGTAKVFLAAVQRNPALGEAVQKAIAEAQGGE